QDAQIRARGAGRTGLLGIDSRRSDRTSGDDEESEAVTRHNSLRYSVRNALIGSSRTARSAGSRLARRAIASATALMAANVAGSVALTSYSIDVIDRPRANAAPNPRIRPPSASGATSPATSC